MKETETDFNLLKNHGILHHNLVLNEIPNRYLGRILTLGKLISYIEK